KVPFFGVDGETGKSAFEPLPLGDIEGVFAKHAQPGGLGALPVRRQAGKRSRTAPANARAPASAELDPDDLDASGLVDDIDDPHDLGQTGWGIVFTASIGQDIKDALQPLIEHRKRQIADGRRPQDADKRLFRDDLTIGKDDTIGALHTRWG